MPPVLTRIERARTGAKGALRPSPRIPLPDRGRRSVSRCGVTSACERRDLVIHAADIDPAALAVAQYNARMHGASAYSRSPER